MICLFRVPEMAPISVTDTGDKTQQPRMDFLPGNDPSEWRYLGDSDNAVPYQKVTLNEHMQWKDFPIENFIGVCAKFSGASRNTGFTCRPGCPHLEHRRAAPTQRRRLHVHGCVHI